MDRMIFIELVDSFSVSLKLITPESDKKGHYEHGEWVRDDNPPDDITGALVPYDDRSVYQSGGTLTSKDRQLFYVGQIPLESIVIDGGDQYKVQSVEDYAQHYADTSIYRVKAVDKLGNYL